MKNKYKIYNALVVIIINALLFLSLVLLHEPIKKLFSRQPEIAHVVELSEASYELSKDYISANQYKTDIEKYTIAIELFPSEKKIRGDVEIKGKILDRNLKQLDFNFYDNFNIEKVELNGVKADYKNSGTRFSVHLNQNISDSFRLRVVYSGKPVSKGLGSFVFTKFNGSSVVYNLSEPIFASTWFPCSDRPDDKALTDIKITNDSAMTSASNGILYSVIKNGRKKTFCWKTVYPVSTYLVCLYSGKYKYFSDKVLLAKKDTLHLNYYVFPEHYQMAKNDFSEHPQAIKTFSKLFGEYPFIKEKYGVAEFMWQMGAMETQTMTGLGSNFLNGQKMFNDMLIHELAHQWWGNCVGLKDWRDIWLNEGFATYCEALYAESYAGFDALKSVMVSKFSEDFEGTLYNPGMNVFGPTVYNKGAWVLHMLRHETGDELFFKILRTYFEKYKFRNASTKDFQQVAEQVSGKKLDWFFRQWVFKGEGILNLLYSQTITQSGRGYNVKLDISQSQYDYKNYSFRLDVRVKFENNNESYDKFFYINTRQKNVEMHFDQKPKEVILDPGGWLLSSIKKI
jgi:aminopeptidase N